MNIQSQTQLYKKVNPMQEESLQNGLCAHAVLTNMFKDFAPHLLKPSSDDEALLQLIQQYLLQEEDLDFKPLEEQLQPAFYGALSGLKILLQKNTIDEVALILKKSKNRFLDWSNELFNP